jgi:hypothetical protein
MSENTTAIEADALLPRPHIGGGCDEALVVGFLAASMFAEHGEFNSKTGMLEVRVGEGDNDYLFTLPRIVFEATRATGLSCAMDRLRETQPEAFAAALIEGAVL